MLDDFSSAALCRLYDAEYLMQHEGEAGAVLDMQLEVENELENPSRPSR